MHYMTFAQIFATMYCLIKLVLVASSQSQSADFGKFKLTDFI